MTKRRFRITGTGKGIYDTGTLPETAKCKEAGKRLSEMTRCPIRNFDDWGVECVPALCGEYTEGTDGE